MNFLLSNLSYNIPHTLEILKRYSFAGGENVVAVHEIGVRGKGVVLTGLENDVQGLSTRGGWIAGVHNGIYIAGADLDLFPLF